MLAQALAVAPGLGSATYLETRVGFRPAAPGGRPLLGPVTGVPGLIIATGLGADGLTMGPHAGGVAARAALGLDPGTDLSPFAPLPSARPRWARSAAATAAGPGLRRAARPHVR